MRRADRLAEALEPNHRDHLSQPWLTGALMVAGLGFGTLGILGLTDVLQDNGGMGLLTATGATAVVGGILTFAVDDSLMSPFFGATLATAGGLGLLTMDRDVGMDRGYHVWPAGIGMFTTAGLVLLDAALTPSPGNAVLSQDFECLSNTACRETLTEADLAAMEHRYTASRPTISRWLVVAPAVIGLLTSGIWTMADYGSEDQLSHTLVGISFITQTGYLLRSAIERDVQDADMASAGFDMALVPTGTGAALVGRF